MVKVVEGPTVTDRIPVVVFQIFPLLVFPLKLHFVPVVAISGNVAVYCIPDSHSWFEPQQQIGWLFSRA